MQSQVDRGTDRRILVVDDDPDCSDALTDALAVVGYDVATARDGSEALASLELGKRPSLILLDLMMPTMDGWQFAAAKQRRLEWANIPVVLLSAEANLPQIATELGAAGYLAKPITLDSLIETVERCRQK